MRTFEQYMEYKSVESLVWEAASLMVELDIDPKEYLTLLVENSWSTGASNFGTGLGNVAQGGLGMAQGAAQLGAGAVGGAWNQGANAVNALKNSQMGQGVRGWWQDFNSADRKLTKAASLIQKVLTDPHVVNAGNGQATQLLTRIIHELSQVASEAKQSRNSTPVQNQVPGLQTPPASQPVPSPTGTP